MEVQGSRGSGVEWGLGTNKRVIGLCDWHGERVREEETSEKGSERKAEYSSPNPFLHVCV